MKIIMSDFNNPDKAKFIAFSTFDINGCINNGGKFFFAETIQVITDPKYELKFKTATVCVFPYNDSKRFNNNDK